MLLISSMRTISSSPDTILLAGKCALIVDDDDDARQLLRTTLESSEMTVCEADSVDEALEALDHASFNLIVSDIGMPDRDGYSFIQAVRGRADGVSIPAVALTSCVRPEDHARALRAGFNLHLGKPLQSSSLIPHLASLLGEKQPALKH
jgi:CheY-like chemotaxis protein